MNKIKFPSWSPDIHLNSPVNIRQLLLLLVLLTTIANELIKGKEWTQIKPLYAEAMKFHFSDATHC